MPKQENLKELFMNINTHRDENGNYMLLVNPRSGGQEYFKSYG